MTLDRELHTYLAADRTEAPHADRDRVMQCARDLARCSGMSVHDSFNALVAAADWVNSLRSPAQDAQQPATTPADAPTPTDKGEALGGRENGEERVRAYAEAMRRDIGPCAPGGFWPERTMAVADAEQAALLAEVERLRNHLNSPSIVNAQAALDDEMDRAEKAEAERDELAGRLSALLCELTGGRLSKTTYDVRTMVQEIDSAYDDAQQEDRAERDRLAADLAKIRERRDRWEERADLARRELEHMTRFHDEEKARADRLAATLARVEGLVDEWLSDEWAREFEADHEVGIRWTPRHYFAPRLRAVLDAASEVGDERSDRG